MARVVALFDDLLLGSNAQGWLRAAGHDVVLAASPARALAAAREADALVADLASGGFDGVAALGAAARARGAASRPRLLGVYSHVDADTRARALAAGADRVVPRSRLAREGAAVLEGLLAAG